MHRLLGSKEMIAKTYRIPNTSLTAHTPHRPGSGHRKGFSSAWSANWALSVMRSRPKLVMSSGVCIGRGERKERGGGGGGGGIFDVRLWGVIAGVEGG